MNIKVNNEIYLNSLKVYDSRIKQPNPNTVI